MTFNGAVTSGNMSEAVLKRKLAARSAHRGQMTKLLNKAQQIVDQAKSRDDGSHDTSESDRSTNISSTVQQLTGIIDSIETKLSWLKVLDEEIVDFTPQEKMEDTIDLLESHFCKKRELNTFLQKYIQL